MRREVLALIISGLLYSLASFAYMHRTFPNKDIFTMIIERLDRIEDKLDSLKD